MVKEREPPQETDYRVILQEYAKGGIKAAILINGIAAIKVFSQVKELQGIGLSHSTVISLTLWAIGVTLADFAWLAGFISAMYVDKFQREENFKKKNIRLSNCFM